MAGESVRAGASGVALQARCAWCGHVDLPPQALRLHVGAHADALFEFECPRCGRLTLGPLERMDVLTLQAVGIRPGHGQAPFELLEVRPGPPIDWDDLIEFHEAMSADVYTPMDASLGLGPAEERDAA